MYNSFCEAVDSGKEVRVVFCDISKAFDRVWHNGLLFKLKSIGISGKLLNWFSNYLADRKQCVVINGNTSEFKLVEAGVPQGSILGPLLFLVYINDIVRELDCNVRLFADDTSLYIVVENPLHAANILDNNLGRIYRWAGVWLVDFNATKTESMLLTRKRIQIVHPDLIMDNTILREVDTHKHLGLIFSQDCGWKSHIEDILNKAWHRLNIIRAFKFKFDRQSLERMYISFVRPVLEYGGPIWDNCNKEEKSKLESVQIEAMRIVTGATKLCSIEKLYKDTGWETLQTRRNKQKLQIFYKMVNRIGPNYLNNLVPPLVQDNSHYSLRNARNVSTIRSQSKLHYDLFSPSSIRDWNSLSEETRNSQSFSIFKSKLNADKVRPPLYYNYGQRTLQIYHTRLRLECSSLKFHLHKSKILTLLFVIVVKLKQPNITSYIALNTTYHVTNF